MTSITIEFSDEQEQALKDVHQFIEDNPDYSFEQLMVLLITEQYLNPMIKDSVSKVEQKKAEVIAEQKVDTIIFKSRVKELTQDVEELKSI